VLRQHGGVDVAIGVALDDRSFATAYAGLRRGGWLVLVALPVIYETRPLAAVNDAIAEVLHGKARARVVLGP
jgi:propanol-preferring alcohol dehydrogenase